MTIMWDIITAIKFAQKIETIADSYGLHIALGGGVLKRGYSEKDLDIFVYPHGNAKNQDILKFHNALYKFGIIDWKKCDAAQKYNKDPKIIYMTKFKDKRIDIFFLELSMEKIDLTIVPKNDDEDF